MSQRAGGMNWEPPQFNMLIIPQPWFAACPADDLEQHEHAALGQRVARMFVVNTRPDSNRYCQLGAEEAKLPRAQPSREYTSAHEGNTSRIAPGEEGAIAGGPVLTGRETMTAELEVVVDRSVNREKLLRVPG